jgi:hypothetical protein
MFFLTKKSYFVTTKKSAKKEETRRQRNERKNEFTFNFKNGRIVKEFTSKLGRENEKPVFGLIIALFALPDPASDPIS